ncbi:MAG: hypothetical protein RJQ07_00535 [Pseudomonadales bacterium]
MTTASLTVGAPLLLLAATQGNIGPSSSGSVNISLTVGHHVRVSGLSDIAFEQSTFQQSNSGYSVGTTSACIHNNGGGPVRLQTLGSGPGGAFTLTASDSAIDYDLHMRYQAQPVADSGLTLQPATHQLVDDNCLQYGPNTSLHVTTDSAGPPATVYTGTLTLMVTAE